MAAGLPTGIDRLPSGRYRARYRDADGAQHSQSFEMLRDAKTWRSRQLAAVQAGTHVGTAGNGITFEAFAIERLAAWRKHKEATRLQVESHLRRHVFPDFGSKKIGAIKPAHVEAWVSRKELELSPATLHVVMAWFRRVFSDAQRQRLIVESPCVGIELPERIKRDVEPLPLEAVDALVDAMPPHLRGTVLVAAWSGLRQGEVLGLRRHRVTLFAREDERGMLVPPSIYVAEQLQTLTGPPKLVAPKTKRSVRRVPIPNVLASGLSQHMDEFPTDNQGFLFRNASNGEPIRRNRFGDVWRKAVETAGLPKGTRFHDLRHTYASLLIEAGESVTVVSKRLGHSSAVETLGTYAHMWPDSDGRTVDVLNAAWARHVSPDVSQDNAGLAFLQVKR